MRPPRASKTQTNDSLPGRLASVFAFLCVVAAPGMLPTRDTCPPKSPAPPGDEAEPRRKKKGRRCVPCFPSILHKKLSFVCARRASLTTRPPIYISKPPDKVSKDVNSFSAFDCGLQRSSALGCFGRLTIWWLICVLDIELNLAFFFFLVFVPLLLLIDTVKLI